ncbi:TetR/AcrR family transcriptional regulator [Natranaerobius thermophilus]|uniref:Transcriptional regulator, TetR family n=1 Tax=Natranaerobius thermophilus (strain ATCC BAA-1301 / DSM 18059 / JW/NM-WN-LF) TaxID=457570 RepID=B2A7N8_NATTJ|nr:TetR/AcrR family transcriptional regulator [Natranaerobius thermophilus]ACB84340.1 transcriptional regulator, TetR family [Natranaerobius thermophilus JW/NM-WN-LF]
MISSNNEFNNSDNRKQEFLMTALELFYEKGYEKTTIKDIINKMDVSKGAFYHYFESKEDVITSLAKEYADRALSIIKRINSRNDLSAVNKINRIFQSINEYKGSSEEKRHKLKDAFYGEENLKLEKKIFNSFKEETIDLFQEIIEEGIAEGSIEEPVCSRELAEFMLYTIKSLNSSIDELVHYMNDEDNDFGYEEFTKRLDNKLRFYEEAFSRVFNLQNDTIKLRESYLNRFVKGS